MAIPIIINDEAHVTYYAIYDKNNKKLFAFLQEAMKNINGKEVTHDEDVSMML